MSDMTERDDDDEMAATDVPCLWCDCDGCGECTGEGGAVCGCQNTRQR